MVEIINNGNFMEGMPSFHISPDTIMVNYIQINIYEFSSIV